MLKKGIDKWSVVDGGVKYSLKKIVWNNMTQNKFENFLGHEKGTNTIRISKSWDFLGLEVCSNMTFIGFDCVCQDEGGISQHKRILNSLEMNV